MKIAIYCRLAFLLSLCVLTACGFGNSHQDLKDYMAEVKAKPKGHIEQIPAFNPYEAFTYGATAVRSPFDKPIAVKEITRLKPSSNVKPDLNRVKEFLERFSLESLSLVGSLEQNEELWLLIDDGVGGVHRIKQGNYIGRNHGQVVAAAETYVSVVEIVPNGLDGWVERPRTLKLRTDE